LDIVDETKVFALWKMIRCVSLVTQHKCYQMCVLILVGLQENIF